MLILLLLVQFSLVFSLTRWEKRTLSCDVDECLLSVRGGDFIPATCSLNHEGLHECDIDCPLADRDSVISKSPPSNRKCIRFHTYNTRKGPNGWSIWRIKDCAKENIILEVHCGFPTDS